MSLFITIPKPTILHSTVRTVRGLGELYYPGRTTTTPRQYIVQPSALYHSGAVHSLCLQINADVRISHDIIHH